MDRQYARRPTVGKHEYAGHVFLSWTRVPGRALSACAPSRLIPNAELRDRLPSDWHLCGNCARMIAASTDVEDTGDYGTTIQ